jgi:hypothetical protein
MYDLESLRGVGSCFVESEHSEDTPELPHVQELAVQLECPQQLRTLSVVA